MVLHAPAGRLIPTGAKVHDLMADLIDQYFATHLNMPWDDAVRLHKEYYTNYGLAIEGLVRHHQIDPLDYNAKVDDALPLEGVIKPNPELRQLLQDIDKSKVTMWLLTNAYVNHAKRVLRLLGIEDLFEGLTYCNYAEQPLICKPDPRMYQRAMDDAGVEKVQDCYFVGRYLHCSLDGRLNDILTMDRRFISELHKGQRVWLDGSSPRGRGCAHSAHSSLAISDPSLARATDGIPPVFQVFKNRGIEVAIKGLNMQ